MAIEKLADKIKRLREAKGWGVVRLSEEAGLSSSSISKVEHGFYITPGTTRKIAKALGVPVSELCPCENGKHLSGSGKKKEPSPEPPVEKCYWCGLLVQWREVTFYEGEARSRGSSFRHPVKMDRDGARHQCRVEDMRRNGLPGGSPLPVGYLVDRLIAEAVVANPYRRGEEGAA